MVSLKDSLLFYSLRFYHTVLCENIWVFFIFFFKTLNYVIKCKAVFIQNLPKCSTTHLACWGFTDTDCHCVDWTICVLDPKRDTSERTHSIQNSLHVQLWRKEVKYYRIQNKERRDWWLLWSWCDCDLFRSPVWDQNKNTVWAIYCFS